jgi:two-component system response regulator PilR (NtrC family)
VARILVVDDERSLCELLEILLGRAGHAVATESDGARARERVAAEEFDLVITDLKLGRHSGLEVLERVKTAWPATEVIVITAFASDDDSKKAQALGARFFVSKPVRNDHLLLMVENALEKRALVRENVRLKQEIEGRTRYGRLLGKSPAMRELFALVDKIAPTRTTVLVTGESGVGKELVARAIHEKSPRGKGAFVAVNCGAIPEGLIESELFGHEKGAFTGAVASREGLFVQASGGTLFLDEVGELPQPMQVKLLRALQEKRVRAVGGDKDVEVDVRIVAATNRDLGDEVKAGRFREDLYYRLNVINLKVPPLRERREDVILLAEHFLAGFAADQGRSGLRFSRDARQALLDYSFPGNVRELENIVERAVTLAEGDEIGIGDLPSHVRAASAAGMAADAVPEGELPPGFSLEAYLEGIERKVIDRALAQANGVKTEAAKLVGLTFRQFRYRVAKLRGEAVRDGDEEAEG